MTELTDEQRARALELYRLHFLLTNGYESITISPDQLGDFANTWLAVEEHVLKSHICKPVWRSVTRDEIKAGWEIRARHGNGHGSEAGWGVAHNQDEVGDWYTESNVLLTFGIFEWAYETTAPVEAGTGNGPTVKEVEAKELSSIYMQLVTEAVDIVNGPRQDTYGNPADSFQQIADFWEAYLKRRAPGPLTPKDVSRMMQLMKISRGATGVDHRDNLIDKIGYVLLEAVI